MQNVQEAMQLLELHYGFSAGQLTKQFHRMSLHCHPDKPGGSTAKMQRVLAARDLCDVLLSRSPGPFLHPEPPDTRPGNAQTPPASAPPSADDLDRVRSYAMEFLAKLREDGPRQPERQQMRAQIKQIALDCGWNSLLYFALDCVQQLARSTGQQCVSRVIY